MFDDDSPIGRLTVESLDDDGEPGETHEQGIHSLLDNYYSLWGGLGATNSQFQMTAAGGSTDTYTIDGNAMVSPEGEFAVGTDGSAFDQSDIALGSRDTIQDIDSFTANAGTQTVSWSATINASPNIDIAETGWLYGGISDDSGANHTVLLERTVLSSTVSTGSNGDISVTYEWDYPAP